MVKARVDPPRVVGTHQIKLMLEVSRTRVAQLVGSKGFPDPFARLGKANIWLADDVEAWAERTGRTYRRLPDDYSGAEPEPWARG